MNKDIIGVTREYTVSDEEALVFGQEDNVRVSQYGKNQIRIQNDRQSTQTIQKLSASKYMVRSTGETRESSIHECRTKDNLKKALRKTWEKIVTNAKHDGSCLFITVTATGSPSFDEFSSWVKPFFRKLKKNLPSCMTNMKYIYLLEPHEKNGWHMHAILIFDKKVYKKTQNEIEETIRDIWTKGKEIKVNNVYDEVGLANYLCRNNEKICRHNEYPANKRFTENSRGLKKPTVKHMKYKDVDLQNMKFEYSRKYSEDGRVVYKENNYRRE